MTTLRAPKLLYIAALMALGWSRANAGVTFADIGKNLEYQQIDDTGTTVPHGSGTDNAFFFGRVFYTSGSYDGGSLSFDSTVLPFNSFAYDCCGSTGGQYQTSYISKSAMDSEFPTNTQYTLEVTDSTNVNPTTDVRITLPDDLYTSTPIPTFSGASFDALHGLTPGEGITITTGVFTPDPNATGGQNFLSIYDQTSNSTVYSGFGASTRDSWTVGSGIFDAGHHYEAQLIFDNYVSTNDDGIPTTARSDLRTDVFFSLPSTVPEPAAWAIMALGFGALGATLRARRRLGPTAGEGATIR